MFMCGLNIYTPQKKLYSTLDLKAKYSIYSNQPISKQQSQFAYV